MRNKFCLSLFTVLLLVSCTTAPGVKKEWTPRITYILSTGSINDYEASEQLKKSLRSQIHTLIKNGAIYETGGDIEITTDSTMSDMSTDLVLMEENVRIAGNYILIDEKGSFPALPANMYTYRKLVTTKDSFDILNDLLKQAVPDNSEKTKWKIYLTGNIELNMRTGSGTAFVSAIPE